MAKKNSAGQRFQAALLTLALIMTSSVQAQELVFKTYCEGSYLGVRLQGTLFVERWATARSFRYYGRFSDPTGNVIELEVFSPSTRGTGGAWTNGMRHRETHLSFSIHETGFVTRTEDEIESIFECTTNSGQ